MRTDDRSIKQECQQEKKGQETERGEIERAAAVPEPCGPPAIGIQGLFLNDQPFFVETQGLFDLDQDLLGQPMPILLLQNQRAEQTAEDLHLCRHGRRGRRRHQ